MIFKEYLTKFIRNESDMRRLPLFFLLEQKRQCLINNRSRVFLEGSEQLLLHTLPVRLPYNHACSLRPPTTKTNVTSHQIPQIPSFSPRQGTLHQNWQLLLKPLKSATKSGLNSAAHHRDQHSNTREFTDEISQSRHLKCGTCSFFFYKESLYWSDMF